MIQMTWWIVSGLTGTAGGVAALVSEAVASFRYKTGRWPWWLLFLAIGVGVLAGAGVLYLVAWLVASSATLSRIGWLLAAATWVLDLVEDAVKAVKDGFS